MRRLPCFPSFSRQIDGADISELLSGTRLAGSSDFTEATDLLNPSATNRILEALSGGFVGQSVVLDDNCDKELHYPLLPSIAKKNKHGHYDVNTTEIRGVRYVTADGTKKSHLLVRVGEELHWLAGERLVGTKVCGQLMGQKTSFPLLCLVNLGCSLAALARAGLYDPRARSGSWNHWRNAIKTVFINGDDRLANSSRGIEDFFWKIAEPIGLRRSAGKSHESPNYASINSQDYVRSGSTWKRVPCIRVGLLFGVRKLAGDPFIASQVVTPLFESVPFRCQLSCIKLFQAQFKEKILKECTSGGYLRNLFLPVALGGMGQAPPALWEWYITDQQRMLATKIIHYRSCDRFEAGPHLSYAPKRIEKKPVWFESTAAYIDSEHDLQDMEEAIFRKRTRNAIDRFKIPLRHHFHYRCTCGDFWDPSHREGLCRGDRALGPKRQWSIRACRVPPCPFKQRRTRVHWQRCTCNWGPWDNVPNGFYSALEDLDEGCNHPSVPSVRFIAECECCPDEEVFLISSNHEWFNDDKLKSCVRPTLTTDRTNCRPGFTPKVRLGPKQIDVSNLSVQESVQWASRGLIQLPA